MKAQRDIKRAAIAANQRLKKPFDDPVQQIMPTTVMTQEARTHHRRQRQRDDRGNHHRDRHHDRKFAEQSADNPAHQQEWNEHRDQ